MFNCIMTPRLNEEGIPGEVNPLATKTATLEDTMAQTHFNDVRFVVRSQQP